MEPRLPENLAMSLRGMPRACVQMAIRNKCLGAACAVMNSMEVIEGLAKRVNV